MTQEEIKEALKGRFPQEILQCPYPLTLVGKLILMAFDCSSITQVNKITTKNFQEYVTALCRIKEPDWNTTGHLAKELDVDMSKPKVNKFLQEFPR
jgi:hypothetical protein